MSSLPTNSSGSDESTAVNVSKWSYLYWGVGIIATLYTSYYLNTTNNQIAAVLVFLGFVLALYYYYVKWFALPAQTQSWPPYTTPCPDFLTLVDPGAQSGISRCLDYVGVSSNGRIKKADPSKATSQMNDSNYVFIVNRTRKNTDLCALAQSYGLTWSSICQ
jgi:hypothetical protein